MRQLQPGEAAVHGHCPRCRQPATFWVHVQQVKHTAVTPGDPKPVALTGVITDLIHDTEQPGCGAETP